MGKISIVLDNRQARRAEARRARQGNKGHSSRCPPPGNGEWYQSTLLWGAASMAVACILPVLAIMRDVRWLLVVAWPFVIIAVWEFAKTKNSARPKAWAAGGGLISALLLSVLYIYLAPPCRLRRGTYAPKLLASYGGANDALH